MGYTTQSFSKNEFHVFWLWSRAANRRCQKLQPAEPDNLDIKISYSSIADNFLIHNLKLQGARHLILYTDTDATTYRYYSMPMVHRRNVQGGTTPIPPIIINTFVSEGIGVDYIFGFGIFSGSVGFKQTYNFLIMARQRCQANTTTVCADE